MKLELLDADRRLTSSFFRRVFHGQALPSHVSARSAPPGAYRWLGDGGFLRIAHALGPYLKTGPNQTATFHEGYRMGFRVFEVDLVLTRDHHLVCAHGPDAADLDTSSVDDLATEARASGTPLNEFAALVQLAEQYPDVRFVLDVKNRFDDAYREIRRQLAGRPVASAFIPQIYDFSQLPAFREAPLLAGEIFTSYRSALTGDQIIEHARRLGVCAVTLTLDRADDPALHIPQDIAVFAHPVDDVLIAEGLLERGFRGIYTSYLAPGLLPELFGPPARQQASAVSASHCGATR